MKEIAKSIIKNAPYDYYKYIKTTINKVGSKKIIQHYLRDHKEPKLQIGCGINLAESWLNTDLQPLWGKIAFMDAGKKFPFEDNTFNFIFSEHVFEHLKFEDSCNFLSESFRVLKPNGVVRIAVPQIDFLFKIYQNPALPIHQEYVRWATESYCKDIAKLFPEKDYSEIYMINNFYRDWGHQFLHNYDSLNNLFAKFSFSNIQRREIGISDFEELCNMEKHGNIIPDKFNRLETLVVEAQKITN